MPKKTTALTPKKTGHGVVLRQKANGQIEQVRKLDLFLKEFVANGGNATDAAMAVGNFKSRGAAAVAGSHYLKEAREAARVYLETQGHTYGKLLDMAVQKAGEAKSPDWWDRVMKLAGYEDFITKAKQGPPSIVNIINAQKDIMSKYVEGEIEGEDTNED